MKALLARVRQVSPSQVLFGEEPFLVLLALVVGGFVFYPLFEDEWPWLLAMVLLGGVAHVWSWCQEVRFQGGGNTDRESS